MGVGFHGRVCFVVSMKYTLALADVCRINRILSSVGIGAFAKILFYKIRQIAANVFVFKELRE